MTRFGVMKHLKVLEEAGLVTTQAARSREAALPQPRPDPARPRPLGQQVRRALGRGAQRAQDRHRGGDDERGQPTQWSTAAAMTVFEIYIKTTPERLWEAITDPEMRRSTASASAPPPTGRRARSTSPSVPGVIDRSPPARTSRSTRRGAWSRASPRSGARMSRRRDLTGDLGDRAGRRLLPARRHPRPAARGRQRRTLRRLADDPLRPEDPAGDRRAAHDPGSLRYAGDRLSLALFRGAALQGGASDADPGQDLVRADGPGWSKIADDDHQFVRPGRSTTLDARADRLGRADDRDPSIARRCAVSAGVQRSPCVDRRRVAGRGGRGPGSGTPAGAR